MRQATDGRPVRLWREPLWRNSVIWLGIPVPILIALVDAYALRACQGQATDGVVLLTYTLFVVQTASLGALVGSQLKRHPLWWGILAWGIVLVNLQVFVIAVGDRWSTANTVGFAFASSQIGALVCFGVLGTVVWRIRMPTALIGLALAIYFAFALSARDTWYVVLLFQSLATAAVCLILRLFEFRIELSQLLLQTGGDKQRMQFSIRHLFYWTTGVAVMVGLGRLIGWKGILAAGLQFASLPDLLVFVPLLTLVSVLAMWGALGRESWRLRLLILIPALPGIGVVLGAYVAWNRGSPWDRLFPVWEMQSALAVGIAWASLAGWLLAGLLLVFRASGHQLQRRRRAGEPLLF